MPDHRKQLGKFGYPEVTCTTQKNKSPENRKSTKNVKMPQKAEVNYLPPDPAGQNEESLEQERVDLLTEVPFQKKKKKKKICNGSSCIAHPPYPWFIPVAGFWFQVFTSNSLWFA